jgi:nucleoside-diphosphate-sugar epimerase
VKILVLGGTGAMGIQLVELFKNKGFDVCVTSRQSHPSEESVQFVKGDAHDLTFLRKLSEQHWDAIVDFMVYTTGDFIHRIDLLLGSTSQYVYISSARVFADSDGDIVENSDRLLDVVKDEYFLSTDEYALAKARQEDVLIKSGKINWTVIRPYITYNEIRLQLGVFEKEEWLYRALKGRTIIFSEDIAQKETSMTSGYDVANAIASIIGKREALGEFFNVTIGSERAKRWDEILCVYLDVLEKHLGFRPKVIYQSSEKFSVFRCGNLKYQVIYDRLFNRRFDCQKISEFTDLSSFVDSCKGVELCLEHFLENPRFKGIDWKMEALRDRQSGERTSLREIRGMRNRIRYLYNRAL